MMKTTRPMKRIISIILTLVIVSVCLASCGAKSGKKEIKEFVKDAFQMNESEIKAVNDFFADFEKGFEELKKGEMSDEDMLKFSDELCDKFSDLHDNALVAMTKRRNEIGDWNEELIKAQVFLTGKSVDFSKLKLNIIDGETAGEGAIEDAVGYVSELGEFFFEDFVDYDFDN